MDRPEVGIGGGNSNLDKIKREERVGRREAKGWEGKEVEEEEDEKENGKEEETKRKGGGVNGDGERHVVNFPDQN